MRAAVTAMIVAALALAGCGGDSAEEKAQAQVCDARADIATQVDSLQGLTPASVTADAVRKPVEAIGRDLRTIRDAQASLSDDRRSEIEAANQAFTAEVRGVAGTILRSTSVQEAQTTLSAAVGQLAASYRESLGRVDCG
jgi:hypothetical protein